jgi:dihydrodipicolinate synthase/N-acetylneuraminate lyase
MKPTGIIPAIGTPLGTGDRVDETGLRRLTRYLLGSGVHGLFVNGSMGGFAFMTDTEQIRAIATVVSETNRAVPVMAGLGESSTSRAVAQARRVAREGADFLTVLPPLFFLTTQQHLIAYFSEIASAVDLPILLYDNPVLTKNPIEPDTIASLRHNVRHIVGVKESNQDCVNLQRLLQLVRGDAGFSVLTGSEFLAFVHLQMGVDGCIGGLYNVCADLAVDLYTAFKAGDSGRATARQQDLIETWQIFRYGAIWGAFDEALRHLGICERATGAPYITPVTDDERAKIHGILDRYAKPYAEVAARVPTASQS